MHLNKETNFKRSRNIFMIAKITRSKLSTHTYIHILDQGKPFNLYEIQTNNIRNKILARTHLYTHEVSPHEKYCEPLSDHGVVPSEDMKRRLFSHLKPYVGSYLNEIFKVSFFPSLECEAHKETKQKGYPKRLERSEEIEELEFYMSTCAKYLLISAFLASRNPAILHDSLFDSTGGSNSRKRKRKTSPKAQEQKQSAEELLMKGPGSFQLERLLAIFQCIVSVADDPSDEDDQNNDGLGIQGGNGGLMSDVLLQLSSLCNANFIIKGGSCPLEGSTRYRSMANRKICMVLLCQIEVINMD